MRLPLLGSVYSWRLAYYTTSFAKTLRKAPPPARSGIRLVETRRSDRRGDIPVPHWRGVFQAPSFGPTMTHGQGLQVARAGVGKPPLLDHPCFSQDLAGAWPVGELSSFFVFLEGDCPLSSG